MHFEFSYNKPSIFDQPIYIKQILPCDGSQIVENGSFIIAEKDNALAEQAKLIEQLKKQLAETCSTD